MNRHQLPQFSLHSSRKIAAGAILLGLLICSANHAAEPPRTVKSELVEQHPLAQGTAVQGLALGKVHYFTSNSRTICRYDKDWKFIEEKTITVDRVNHLGAISYHDGHLWAGMLHGPVNGKHDPELNAGIIAKIRVRDLQVVQTWDITDDVDWIDPVFYDGNHLYVGDLSDLGIHRYTIKGESIQRTGIIRYPPAMHFSQGIRIAHNKLYTIHTFGEMDGLFEFDLPQTIPTAPLQPTRVWPIQETKMHLEGFDFIPGKPNELWHAQGKQVDRYVLTGLPTAQTTPAAARTEVIFYAMGDVPYAAEEDALLPKQIANLPTDGHFVVHVGDIKDGATPCDEQVYIKVSSMLAKSKLPAFIIPGDNEWNDCTAPDQAWKYWVKHFTNFDTKWKYSFNVRRQAIRNENFSFNIDGVLFLGINLVGGLVHDEAEWKTRHAQDLTWIKEAIQANQDKLHAIVLLGHAHPAEKHNDFFTPLLPLIKAAGLPTLYLHGDGHRWIQDKPFGTDLITRIQVDQGGIAPPLKITVTNSPAEPFIFDRRKPETP